MLAWLGFPPGHLATAIIGDTPTLEYHHNETGVNFWLLYQEFDNMLERPLDPGYSTQFYGEREPFALSTGHYGIALVMLPVYLLSGKHLILTYNLYLILTFQLSAWAVYLLAREVADAPPPVALVIGLAAAFAGFRVVHIRILDNLSTHWYWLALWMFHRLLGEPRVRWLIGLGLMALLTVLSSGYYGVFLLVTLGLIGGYGLLRRVVGWRHALYLIGAGGVAAILCLPFVVYRFGNPTFAAGHRYETLVALSARPADWLRGSAWLFGGYEPSPGGWEDRLLIGIGLLVMSAVAAYLCWKRQFDAQPAPGRALSRRQAAEVYLIVLGAGYVLSLGPQLGISEKVAIPLPYWLLHALPGLRSLRVVERFVFVALTGGLILSAAVLAHWHDRLKTPRQRWLMTGVIAALLAAELFPANRPAGEPDAARLLAPTGREFEAPFVEWLSEQPPGTVVMHYPIGLPYDWEYPVYVAWHEQPSLNGLGSLTPDWYPLTPWQTRPNVTHLVEMWRRGVRYVLIHRDMLERYYDDGKRARFEAQWGDLQRYWTAFEMVGRYGEVDIYRVRIEPPDEVLYEFDSAAMTPAWLGWSPPDRDVRGVTFAWTSRASASLYLFVDPGQDVAITLRAIGGTSSAILDTLTIEANGIPVALDRERDADGAMIYTGRIAREILERDPGVLHLRILTDAAAYLDQTGQQAMGAALDWLRLASAGE